MRARLWLVAFVVVAVACGGATSSSTQDEQNFSSSDFAEDSVLPVRGDWLDPPKALAGIGQFDRLHATVHDDDKCSTMVAMAAAVVGGKTRFVTFLDAVARLRADHPDDVAIVDGVRAAIAATKLTPRHIHELTEVVTRAYKVEHGAFDSDIARMVRASGYAAVDVGSSKPAVLVDHLLEGEVVPLGTVADGIPHITLLWKDAEGVVRLYDSDDVHGTHVMPRGSAGYTKRIEDPQSSWDRGEKYR